MNLGITDALKKVDKSSQSLEKLLKEQQYTNYLLEEILINISQNKESSQARIKSLREKIFP